MVSSMSIIKIGPVVDPTSYIIYSGSLLRDAWPVAHNCEESRFATSSGRKEQSPCTSEHLPPLFPNQEHQERAATRRVLDEMRQASTWSSESSLFQPGARHSWSKVWCKTHPSIELVWASLSVLVGAGRNSNNRKTIYV